MNTILLYNPKAVFYDMPLALLSIGSMLDTENYRIIIVDGRIDPNPLKKIKSHLSESICFGVTALTGNPLIDALDITRQVKQMRPDLPIIWGGWHPSLFPTETLQEEMSIDITVQGQGEVTFQSLIMALEAGSDLNYVNGICYRSRSNEVIENTSRALADMNELTPVNYDLINPESYFTRKKNRQLDYISSTGCRFRCTFCADPHVYNRKWSAISPERMGDELSFWYKKYKFTDINFQDETFFTHRKRVVGIAEEILKRGIKVTWAGTMRADQGFRMSPEELDLCKKSGLRRVLVGVESGSQEMMDWMKKDIKIEQVYEVARRCAQRNIAVIFPFIVGFPGESESSVISTLDMAMELNQMHHSFTTPIFYFKPYPGSKITEDVVSKGYQLPKDINEWAKFDYIGSTGPWVSDSKYKLIENFKFYNKLAGRNNHPILAPFSSIANMRLKSRNFKFPVEKLMAELFFSTPKLS